MLLKANDFRQLKQEFCSRFLTSALVSTMSAPNRLVNLSLLLFCNTMVFSIELLNSESSDSSDTEIIVETSGDSSCRKGLEIEIKSKPSEKLL